MSEMPARDPTPEERIEALLGERRRELETEAARFEESVRDLERREELLRDSRASLERLLRLGTSDLDSRESELAQLIHELTSREERVLEAEADLARRRGELGAVELKRAALERQEKALVDREEEIAGRESQLSGIPAVGAESVVLALAPGAKYRLVDIELTSLGHGDMLTIEGEEYDVARIGPSPLPGDSRRCAYLMRGMRRGSPPSGGSS
ncbi:MAG: hypothetical protein WD015_08405 [Gaiellaceae bacterium]